MLNCSFVGIGKHRSKGGEGMKTERDEAIKQVLAHKSLMLMVVPVGLMDAPRKKVWVTIDTDDLYESELETLREISCFETAIKEDIFDCKSCGHHVAIFEDVCPNCGNFPHPQEEEA